MLELSYLDQLMLGVVSTLISKRICVFTQINNPKKQLELNW